MPIWKCNNCQHEWEGLKTDNTCEWCECTGFVLEESTDFEKYIREEGKHRYWVRSSYDRNAKKRDSARRKASKRNKRKSTLVAINEGRENIGSHRRA